MVPGNLWLGRAVDYSCILAQCTYIAIADSDFLPSFFLLARTLGIVYSYGMDETEKKSARLELRVSPGWLRLVELAAAAQTEHGSVAEYIRTAVVEQLERDGYAPAQEGQP